MKKRFPTKLVTIILASILMLVVALPGSIKSNWPNNFVTNWLKQQAVILGLDLQGGTQLTYRIDLTKINEQNNDDDPENDRSINDVVRGVTDVLERRVNGLGVSEPRVYASNVGDEKHVIVELAGIDDIEKAKQEVGKVIQLDFRELKGQGNPEEGEEEIDEEIQAKTERANQILTETLEENTNFLDAGERNTTFDNSIELVEGKENFLSELSPSLAQTLPNLEPGQVHDSLVEGGNEFTISPDGQLIPKELLKIVQLQSKDIRENSEEIPEQVKAKQILIAYAGAENASEEVTRTQEEAEAEANRILEELKADPEKFAELAGEFSDDSATSEAGGEMDFFTQNAQPTELSEAAFAMEVGNLTEEVIESPRGYHIVQVTEKKEAETRTFDEDYFVYNTINIDVTPSPWKSTGLDGSHFRFASVSNDQNGFPIVNITFDSEGAELFGEITGRLVGQPLAIFVGGELIQSPNVNEKIVTGTATISGGFDVFEAHALANSLNTGAIDAPIIPVGENTISASLGDNALAVSLLAGIIGLIVLAVFMILYYRLMGIFAVLALGIYTIIIVFILNVAPLVMTLAGVAGIILSIGMAVDANILIFERTKEELNEGRRFSNAVNVGFERAWSSIRDSNVSSLITCAILYFFGTSVIKGFAIMLAIGILVSMFTAITVTKAFLKLIDGTKMSKSKALLGVKKLEEKK